MIEGSVVVVVRPGEIGEEEGGREEWDCMPPSTFMPLLGFKISTEVSIFEIMHPVG